MKNNQNYNGWSNRETWAYILNLTNRYETNKMVESWTRTQTVDQLEITLYNYLINLKKISVVLDQPNEVHQILNDIGNIEAVNCREIAEDLKND